jgi:hypothetical protein
MDFEGRRGLRGELGASSVLELAVEAGVAGVCFASFLLLGFPIECGRVIDLAVPCCEVVVQGGNGRQRSISMRQDETSRRLNDCSNSRAVYRAEHVTTPHAALSLSILILQFL